MTDSRRKSKLQHEEIVELRRNGQKFTEIAVIAGISPARVGQIARRYLPVEEDPTNLRTQRGTKRFTATELPHNVRQALESAADKQDESLSKFIATAIIQRLTALGEPIPDDVRPYNGEPLPFEEEAH